MLNLVMTVRLILAMFGGYDVPPMDVGVAEVWIVSESGQIDRYGFFPLEHIYDPYAGQEMFYLDIDVVQLQFLMKHQVNVRIGQNYYMGITDEFQPAFPGGQMALNVYGEAYWPWLLEGWQSAPVSMKIKEPRL